MVCQQILLVINAADYSMDTVMDAFKRAARKPQEAEGTFGSVIPAVHLPIMGLHVSQLHHRGVSSAARVKHRHINNVGHIKVFIWVNSTYCKHGVYPQAAFSMTTALYDKTQTPGLFP